MLNGTSNRWWLALSVFGVAMGVLKDIAVVWLSVRCSLAGFTCPLATMPRAICAADLARAAFQTYTPARFDWLVFLCGLLTGFAAAWRMRTRAALRH